MLSVPCYIADFNLAPETPVVTDFVLNTKPLVEYYRRASGTAGIEVGIDWTRRHKFPNLVTTGGVNDGHLMDGLATLLRPDASSGAMSIGLLIADLYTPSPGQYGLMFDIDGEEGSFGPRQGCAIFLSAIRLALAGADLPDDSVAFQEFVAYTAVHEIGHAFNLWHLPGSSFMQPHPNPADRRPYVFDPSQTQYLELAADASSRKHVLPGGSQFADRPPGWPSHDGKPYSGLTSEKSPIILQIALSHTSFWSFEPVELDVQIHLGKGRSRPFTIKDEIDPGYPSFQIWITRPDGERFLYRSQTRFCRTTGRRMIRKDTPFRRDIAVFRQAGGYTFKTPGKYTIQAVFYVNGREAIQSNTIECDVLPAQPKSPGWKRANALLQTNELRNLLRYKHQCPSLDSYARIVQFASKDASKITACAIHYALGKALLRQPVAHKYSLFVRKGIEHLKTAIEVGQLSSYRAEIANSMIEKNRA